MELMEGIYSRRSVRKYTGQPVALEHLVEIVTAGTRAPSGLNNQPWRFVIVRERSVREHLAKLTTYHSILLKAPACIAVFADTDAMYHEVKDHQAMGACLQNMLLAAHAMGLGAVWLGEILKNARAVRELLELPETMDLMAVVAVGHPAGSGGCPDRLEVSKVLLKVV